MAKKDIIVIGASAGGVTALQDLVASLPADLKAAVFVVLHIPTYSRSNLPVILGNAGPLEAIHPIDGQRIEHGRIYIAPNDHHLVLKDDRMLVRRGPRENRFRPSIDALFRSAAYEYRERVIGIILSGVLNDGVSGLWAVKEFGGSTIIQSLEEAHQPQLPENVLEYVQVDHILEAAEMGALIAGMVNDPVKKGAALNELQEDRIKTEVTIASSDSAFELGILEMGIYTPFTCAECHGSLVRLPEGKLLRYRCHTGHAYTASALMSELTSDLEVQIWQVMRGLEEVNMLMKNVADHYRQLNEPITAALFELKANEGITKAAELRKFIMQQHHFSEDLRLEVPPRSM